jgi:hypothetical protein
MCIVFSGAVPYLSIVIKPPDWGLEIAVDQVNPWKLTKPGMVFDLLDTSPAQSLHWLPLEQFVHEISSFNTPPLRNVPLPNNHLSLLDLLLYVFPRLARVWPLAHHHFVDNHPNRIEVDLEPMVMVEHDLWGHVSRRTRRILSV